MNADLTGTLQAAFEEMADVAPPAGLAQLALRRARRQRMARLTAGGVGAAVCAALVGVVAAVTPIGGTAGNAAAGQPDGLRPLVVTAYSGIRDPKVADPSPAFNYSVLLNPDTGRYDRIPYRSAMPSPDGGRVLVGEGDNSAAHPTRVGVLDRATGRVRWIPAVGTFPAYASNGNWSPDGRHILFTHKPKAGTPGFVLVDSETLQPSIVSLPDLAAQDAQGIGIVWTPDGNGFARTISQVNAEQTAYTVTGIRFYDLTGKVLRTIPAIDSLTSAAAFSPDGDQLALARQDADRRVFTVVDSGTGAVRKTIILATVGALIGWADDQHLLVRVPGDAAGNRSPGMSASAGGTGDDQHDRLAVVDLSGRVTRTMRISERFATQIYVGSSAGLPRDAAKITL